MTVFVRRVARRDTEELGGRPDVDANCDGNDEWGSLPGIAVLAATTPLVVNS